MRAKKMQEEVVNRVLEGKMDVCQATVSTGARAKTHAGGEISGVRVAAPRPERFAGQATIFKEESTYKSSSSSSVRCSAPRESSWRTSLSDVTKQVLILPNGSKALSKGSDDSIQADLRL
jgi:hypothetical protein